MKMIKKIYDRLYWFLAAALIFIMINSLVSCRSKKSTLDHKTKDVESISIIDKSINNKKEITQEKIQETKTENIVKKTIEEAWMSFEGDKMTITDKEGNKTEITNPRFSKGASKSNENAKSNISQAESDKVVQKEENEQKNLKVDDEKESTSVLKKTDERKTKIVWLYWIGSIIVVLVLISYDVIKIKK